MASVAPSQSTKVATVEFRGAGCDVCFSHGTGLALVTLELFYQWNLFKLCSRNQLR